MTALIYWTTISEFLVHIGLLSLIVVIMLRKWLSATPRYLSDIPFVIAVSFLFIMYDRVDSTLGLSGIMPVTQVTSIISMFGFLAIVSLNLVIFLIIWMPDRKRLRSTFIVSWIVLWTLLIGFFGLTGSADSLHTIIFMMSIPVMLLLTVTWYFCYFQKRLSVINPLLVGIGFTIFFVSVLLRVVVSAAGVPIGYVFTDLHWIPLSLDIAAFSVMVLGFSREMNY